MLHFVNYTFRDEYIWYDIIERHSKAPQVHGANLYIFVLYTYER